MGGTELSQEQPRHIIDLTRRERIVVIALTAALLATLAVRSLLNSTWWIGRPHVIERSAEIDYRIDLNTATREELRWLSGVGESTAEAIVKYRDENGPFGSVDDLANVPKLGRALVDRLRPYVRISVPGATVPQEPATHSPER